MFLIKTLSTATSLYFPGTVTSGVQTGLPMGTPVSSPAARGRVHPATRLLFPRQLHLHRRPRRHASRRQRARVGGGRRGRGVPGTVSLRLGALGGVVRPLQQRLVFKQHRIAAPQGQAAQRGNRITRGVRVRSGAR